MAREVLARGVNVIAQLVARRNVDGALQLSLGSNPDVTVDLLPLVAAARAGGRDIVLVGETHAQMPFMTGHAQVDPQAFDFLVDSPRYDYDLFGPPNPPLAHGRSRHRPARQRLVRDGGTLQVGIGELGDALIYSLLLRHQQNAAWRGALGALGAERSAALVEAEGGTAPFAHRAVRRHGNVRRPAARPVPRRRPRRRVYDSLPLERLLAGGGGERVDAAHAGGAARGGRRAAR